jgi:hypothetical protein
MSQLELEQVPGTRLYRAPASGPFVLFLLWETADAPQTIATAETWTGPRVAPRTGWYLFAEADPVDADLERAVRDRLGAPGLTSLAWISYADAALTVYGAAAPIAGGTGQAVLRDDVPLLLPAGMPGLTLLAGAPVTATAEVDAFTVTCPSVPGASPPRRCVRVPLFGAAAGTIGFQALVGGAGGPGVVKSLLRVQVDPARPFDGRRTFWALSGREYLLLDEAVGYRLVPERAA